MQTSDWSDMDQWIGNFCHLPNRPENIMSPSHGFDDANATPLTRVTFLSNESHENVNIT
jgi:hypothetical protein